ncbi:MAG: YigZ family protein [Ignavibacteria bacterium GWF2_33_9]|nr:MAG: YigZ family protein [Ignavibacteria bacterium GWF2_33_9]
MVNLSDNSDFYFTIANNCSAEIKIKGSRFIGQVFPISSRDNAEEILALVRKEHYNATHNCFAYSLGLDGNTFRYSDDGEPSGTAGKPIFQAINSFDYKDILVIVTRYFGGTKLGVGPLARAYAESAKTALELTEKKIIYLTKTFKITCDYNFIAILKHTFENYSINLKEEYEEKVCFIIDVLESQADKFEKLIVEKTNDKVEILPFNR